MLKLVHLINIQFFTVGDKIKPIAFLGPQGTFSHEAASLVSDNLVSFCSIPSVMESVANGECEYGVVPIENSIEGSVTLTLDSMIHNFDLKIRNEIVIPINHNLLAARDMSVDEVQDVYSHSQALGQCQPYLERHGMTPHYTLSTAAAAHRCCCKAGCRIWRRGSYWHTQSRRALWPQGHRQKHSREIQQSNKIHCSG